MVCPSGSTLRRIMGPRQTGVDAGGDQVLTPGGCRGFPDDDMRIALTGEKTSQCPLRRRFAAASRSTDGVGLVPRSVRSCSTGTASASATFGQRGGTRARRPAAPARWSTTCASRPSGGSSARACRDRSPCRSSATRRSRSIGGMRLSMKRCSAKPQPVSMRGSRGHRRPRLLALSRHSRRRRARTRSHVSRYKKKQDFGRFRRGPGSGSSVSSLPPLMNATSRGVILTESDLS